jgi:hypothetical protein
VSDEKKTLANMPAERIAAELRSQLTYSGKKLVDELLRRLREVNHGP